jgi:hypothetical protein
MSDAPKVRRWDRTEVAKYTLDVFGERISSGNADVRMNGTEGVVITVGGMAAKKSRAERYHGDLRFKPQRRRRGRRS